MHAKIVGELIGKQDLICVPFGGGLSELPYLDARQILVNDQHKHLYNLYYVVANMSGPLFEMLDKCPYHPASLEWAKSNINNQDELEAAVAYFIVNWMTRCAGGTDKETDGSLAMRWTASGGSSIARWRAAVEGLPKWAELLRTKCECTCLDWREIAKKWVDRKGHAAYLDPPWIGAGDDYVHTFDDTDHLQLAQWLDSLEHTTVVVRHSDNGVYRALYPEPEWEWHYVDAKNQHGNSTGEVLIRRLGK